MIVLVHSRKTPSSSPSLVAVFFLETLGGELHRRQGILDLMGHPPCHLTPGGRPLRPLQLGQILEDHRHAHLLPLIVVNLR